MKLIRFGPDGNERPGLLVDDATFVDVGDLVYDFGETFFAQELIHQVSDAVTERVKAGRVRSLAGVRLGAPISRPHQIICIGLNYVDHAVEAGMDLPTEPLVFTKSPNTISGPFDSIPLPPNSTHTDWEVEIGVVIGRRCSYLSSPADAGDYIAGYVLVNDVSERHHQLDRGGQWTKGKSHQRFNPCGPWLATPDEFQDPGNVRLWLDVNGDRQQDGTTADMVFGFPAIVHYLSQFMTLEPGDLINTGTPAGVGLAKSPQHFLSPDDVVTLGADGLGQQRLRVVATPDHGKDPV